MDARTRPIFTFPDEANWDDATTSLTFPVGLGDYQGTVFVALPVFVTLMERRPTPAEADAFFHANRAVFEKAVEERLTNRALDVDANVHLTGRDLARAVAGMRRGSGA